MGMLADILTMPADNSHVLTGYIYIFMTALNSLSSIQQQKKLLDSAYWECCKEQWVCVDQRIALFKSYLLLLYLLHTKTWKMHDTAFKTAKHAWNVYKVSTIPNTTAIRIRWHSEKGETRILHSPEKVKQTWRPRWSNAGYTPSCCLAC